MSVLYFRFKNLNLFFFFIKNYIFFIFYRCKHNHEEHKVNHPQRCSKCSCQYFESNVAYFFFFIFFFEILIKIKFFKLRLFKYLYKFSTIDAFPVIEE